MFHLWSWSAWCRRLLATSDWGKTLIYFLHIVTTPVSFYYLLGNSKGLYNFSCEMRTWEVAPPMNNAGIGKLMSRDRSWTPTSQPLFHHSESGPGQHHHRFTQTRCSVEVRRLKTEDVCEETQHLKSIQIKFRNHQLFLHLLLEIID